MWYVQVCQPNSPMFSNASGNFCFARNFASEDTFSRLTCVMCIDSNYININLIINIDIIDGIGLHSLTVSPIQASTRQVCAWDKKRGRTGKTSTFQTPSAEALMCPRPKILLIMQTSSVMNKTSGIISTISWSRGERAFNNIGKKRSEIVFSVESLLG